VIVVDDLRQCPDCELFSELEPDSLCPACAEFRRYKFADMDEEWKERMARRERMRMTPNQRFAEGLADMAKAVERSRR